MGSWGTLLTNTKNENAAQFRLSLRWFGSSYYWKNLKYSVSLYVLVLTFPFLVCPSCCNHSGSSVGEVLVWRLTDKEQLKPVLLYKLYLCPVRLSQKVMLPSVPRVSTQVCGVPLVLVPTHTYASRPNPSRRLHRRVAWSSQSPYRGQIVMSSGHLQCLKCGVYIIIIQQC